MYSFYSGVIITFKTCFSYPNIRPDYFEFITTSVEFSKSGDQQVLTDTHHFGIL